jgi:FkbM family methyltransferase
MLSEKDIVAFENAVIKSRQSFLSRFLYRPARYLAGNGYYRFVYPLIKKPWIKRATLFFGKPLLVPLPAGLDLYLLGIKTHHSEIRLARMLIRNVHEGQIFIDVGAHVGYFSLLAAELTGKRGRVFAFEASSSIFPFLQQNIRKTDVITALNQAVSARNEILTMKEYPILFSEYNTVSKQQDIFSGKQPPPYFEKKVEGVTLDTFFNKNNIRPDWIKIDVEGSEKDVVQGLIPFLHAVTPRIIMEYIPGPAAEVYLTAVNMLMQAGYKAFLIDDSGMLKETNVDQLKLMTSDSENIVFSKNAD